MGWPIVSGCDGNEKAVIFAFDDNGRYVAAISPEKLTYEIGNKARISNG
jgi:hypothetical protein